MVLSIVHSMTSEPKPMTTSLKDYIILIGLSLSILSFLVVIYGKTASNQNEITRLTEASRSSSAQFNNFAIEFRKMQTDIVGLKVAIEGLKVKNGDGK